MILKHTLLAGLIATVPSVVYGATYYGRITGGGFISKEQFAEASDGQSNNDFLTASSRLYLKASDIGTRRLELTADLRDKHDVFDKLDSERLQLTSKNTFQARQFSIRALPSLAGADSNGNAYYSLGRFPIPEAGPVNVDGAELGYRWNGMLRASLFGGYNPERPDQTYLQFNPDSKVLGAYGVIQSPSDGVGYLYLANAVTAQTVSGHVDRLFWSESLVYRWKAPNSVTSLFNVDFTPRVYVQFASVSWFQQWMERRTSTVRLTAFDVIQYSRHRGVLETLPPSPYREATLNLSHRLNPVIAVELNLSQGIRASDNLQRTEISAGSSFSRFPDRRLAVHPVVGYRRNFTSKDGFLRLDLGWYSRSWEVTVDGEYGIRAEPGFGTLHPILAELAVAHSFSRALYGTVSVQQARDERVSITSGFVKFSYRFGSQDVAPLRDGAPLRGRL